ncbi:MAG: hypothetical protein Q9216_006905, partial [Gyalolechia sp. 2 TL-2023]
MVKQKKPRTWAEEIADLDDPAPKDLDPEQPNDGNSSEESSRDDGAEAKDHYLHVGKSHLRNTGTINLGPEYSGSHISRNNLLEATEVSDDSPFASARSRQGSLSDAGDSGEYADPDNVDLDMDNNVDQDEEIDSDEAFGDGDEEKFQGFTFRGPQTTHQDSPEHEQVNGNQEGSVIHEDSAGFSDMDSDGKNTTPITDERGGSSAERQPGSAMAMDDVEDTEMEDHESLASEADGSESETSSYNADDAPTRPPVDEDRAALRKMMAESQKVITSSLSQVAKSDIAKGRAIKHQRTTFDSLLNTRIRLQKALVATNSPHTPSPPSNNTTTDPA